MTGAPAANRRPASIFISYAREDGNYATELASSLSRYGFSVHTDQSIPVGENFTDSLRQAIDQADATIALMSPEYFSSRWCQFELAAAMNGEKRVLPVLLRGEVKGPLAYLVYVDGRLDPSEVALAVSRAVGNST